MYRFRAGILTLGLGCAVAGAASAETGKYGIGRAPTAQEIAGWAIAVRPDGRGLPPGSGSVAAGEKLYEQKCTVCHGSFGESTEYHVLAGGRGSLATSEPVATVGSKWQYATTLFDFIRRAMPMKAPKSLSADEVYALTAYVLYLNDILPASARLDQHTLPRLRMPNAGGFTTAHGLMRIDGKPDTGNAACMQDCPVSAAAESAMRAAPAGAH